MSVNHSINAIEQTREQFLQEVAGMHQSKPGLYQGIVSMLQVQCIDRDMIARIGHEWDGQQIVLVQRYLETLFAENDQDWIQATCEENCIRLEAMVKQSRQPTSGVLAFVAQWIRRLRP